MKKFGLLFVVVLSLTFFFQLSAQNVSLHFSELKGMEDAQGNTHLFYRISSSYEQGYFSSDSNLIYNFVPHTLIDTIFLYDGGYCDIFTGYSVGVSSYDFWNQDPAKFIYCGMQSNCYEGSGYISRYDSQYVRNGLFETYIIINISKQNDSLLYCAYPIMRSTNGGFNWGIVSDSMTFLSLSPFNDQVYFASGPFYWWGGSYLYKTTNGGDTFSPVDTLGNSNFDFYYDIDGNNIYRLGWLGYPTYSVKRSAVQGNAFTWENIYSSQNVLYLCLDESQSGAIYLADGNKIMFSSNYGTTFNLYKVLDKKIIGIYKKPDSDKLYAATKYKLYEITNNSLSLIKSLPIPSEALEFYPLQIGNKWFYERIDYSLDWITGNTIIDTSYFQRRVIGLENKPNGKRYYKIDDYDFYTKLKFENFERIDSSTGLVYRYDSTLDSTDFECIIDDLMVEQGNLINTSRLYSYYNPVGMIFENEDYFNDWGSYRKRNGFSGGSFGAEYYSLTQGIGLDSVFVSLIDAFDAYIDIKGCVINGIVYGDTTLTDFDGCIEPLLPTHFELEQNYPNPFNPSTKICWQSPVAAHQTLKVYDVLGNEVATLVDEYRNAGSYEIDFNASSLSSGIYFYQLKAGDFINTKKMIVLK
jgi:hypothetical protein